MLTLSEILCPPAKTAVGKLVFGRSCQIRAYGLEWDIGFAVAFLEPDFLHLNLTVAYVVMMSPNHDGKTLVSPTVRFLKFSSTKRESRKTNCVSEDGLSWRIDEGSC